MASVGVFGRHVGPMLAPLADPGGRFGPIVVLLGFLMDILGRIRLIVLPTIISSLAPTVRVPIGVGVPRV